MPFDISFDRVDRTPGKFADAVDDGDAAELHRLSEQRWLSPKDLSDLRDRIASGLPPKTPRGMRPATWLEVGRLLGSYNAWIRLWNVHETSRELCLSPDWWDGSHSVNIRGSLLNLHLNEGRTLQIRCKRGWYQFHDGWSCQRNELPIDAVRSAGWWKY